MLFYIGTFYKIMLSSHGIYLVVHCCLFGSFACVAVRSIRVDDETFVTATDAELILENMNDQQQGKHLLDHFCSYMNS